jgi:hypothetical protein
MPFSKTFPKTTDKSMYPKWIEVVLSGEEEKTEEKKCRDENISLMKECIDDAREIMKNKDLKEYQSDLISMAISLFEKRASHVVYWKESKAKEKFDEKYSD